MRYLRFLTLISMGISVNLLKGQVANPIQNLRNFVVKIHTLDEFGDEEIGTGILYAGQGGESFVITARHVVYDEEYRRYGQEIQIYDLNNPQRALPAKVVKEDVDLDLCLLQLNGNPLGNKDLLCVAQLDQMETQSEVICIGHGAGRPWMVNQQNQITELAFSLPKGKEYMATGLFTISSNGIYPGYSGGPVFDSNHGLIGMLTNRGDGVALGIRISIILDRIKKWLTVPRSYFGICEDSNNMRYVAGGTFTSESQKSPGKEIRVGNFWMDTHEVTNQEFCAFLNDEEFLDKKKITQLWYEGDHTKIKKVKGVYRPMEGYEQYPVVNVTWLGANEFAKWNNKRLPTEAEWEYAARGGKLGQGSMFLGEDKLKQFAWFGEAKSKIPHEIQQKEPNALQLYDMLGNVSEWCAGSPPQASSSKNKNKQVYRGGAWLDKAGDVQVSRRFYGKASKGEIYIGFRCVRDMTDS